jgi:hypothetical protein
MNLTLINVAQVHVMRPLARSRGKLETIVEILNNPRIRAEDIQTGFAKYLTVILRARVQEAIRTQQLGRRSMKDVYDPLSKRYQESKPKRTKNMFWMNTGHLSSSLTVWRERDMIKIGFKGSQYYPGTRTKTIKVLLWNERGTRNNDGSVRIPARPLFVPLAKFLTKNVGRYFEAYIKHTFRIDVKAL